MEMPDQSSASAPSSSWLFLGFLLVNLPVLLLLLAGAVLLGSPPYVYTFSLAIGHWLNYLAHKRCEKLLLSRTDTLDIDAMKSMSWVHLITGTLMALTAAGLGIYYVFEHWGH